MKRLLILFTFIITMVFSNTATAANLRYKEFPIQVYIAYSPHKATVKQAFSTWTNMTRIAKFQYTQKQEEAQIIVDFETQPAVNKGEAYVAGYNTNYPADSNYIKKSKIVIKSNIPGRNINAYDRQIYMVALHEIGHALGLAHSNNSNDTMYYMQNGQLMLSTNDINAFKKLYGN